MKNNLINKIIKNSGIIFAGNSMASALNISSFALMARSVGVESLAVFVLAQTYALLLNDIFNIQTWESMVKFGSQKGEVNTFRNIVKANVVLDLISAIFAFLMSLVLIYPLFHLFGWDDANIYLVGIYTISILFNITSLTIGVPRLFDEFSGIAKIQVSMAFIKIICILITFTFDGQLLVYICIYLVIEIFLNLSLIGFSFLLLKRKLGTGWWRVKLDFNKNHLKFVWWTNLRSIVRIPVRRFDVIIISSVMSLKVLGMYKVYKEITGIIDRIGEPVNQSIYPVFTKLISEKDSTQSILIAKKTILLMSGVSLILTSLLLISSSYIVGIIFGAEYLENVWALYFMIIISGISFSIAPINSLFIAAGFAKSSFYIVIFTNTIYLLVAYILGTMWGVYGVIFANLVQMVLNQSLKIILMKKNSHGWHELAR